MRTCTKCGNPWEPKSWQLKHGHARHCDDCRQPDPHNAKEYRTARAERMRMAGRKCERCGTRGETGNRLECNHVDGNPRNNGVDNLEILCRNCHKRTFTKLGKAEQERFRVMAETAHGQSRAPSTVPREGSPDRRRPAVPSGPLRLV